MKCYNLLIPILVLAQFVNTALGISEASTSFDGLLVMTRQDKDLDWWNKIPSRFSPNFRLVDQVVIKETFAIFPVFHNYATDQDHQTDLTYQLIVTDAEGNEILKSDSIRGFEQPIVHTETLLPASNKLIFAFDENNVPGVYHFQVLIRDHLQHSEKTLSGKVELIDFEFKPDDTVDTAKWAMEFFENPHPADAIKALLNCPPPFHQDNNQLSLSMLWFFKCIYEVNPFLVPLTVDVYKYQATGKQKASIEMLFHLLGKLDLLPIEPESDRVKTISKIAVPDIYLPVENGDQLDLLWGEFLATGKYRPLRQILSAFNLEEYAGTLDKLKSGELAQTDENRKNAYLNAVLNSAIWSVGSNCLQHELVFQYCIFAYEQDTLNQHEKTILGSIIQHVVDEKKKSSKAVK